jgi:hypothetical protein
MQWVTVVICVLTFRPGVIGEIAHYFKRALLRRAKIKDSKDCCWSFVELKPELPKTTWYVVSCRVLVP